MSLRLVHKATDGLSEEAQRILVQGFREKKTYAAIARDLDEIGEAVPERTIARRATEWRAEQERRREAREYVHDLVGAMRANDLTAAEMVQALAMDSLMSDPEAFTGSDPVKVQRLSLRAQELRSREKDLEIRERAITVEETKLKLLEAREQRALAATKELQEKAGRGETLTPEDLNRIREIYGLQTEGANG